jgi:hypothetical protein
MISSINNRNFTQGLSFKHQNTNIKNKANEEANESTSEKIAETNKQNQNTVSFNTKNNKTTSALNSKTGNVIDFHA